jgi:hypothetical protein
MTTTNTLPAKQTVLNSFNGIKLVRFTTRSNQHILTVSFSDYLKATQIAESFGNADTIAKQQWVKINIA